MPSLLVPQYSLYCGSGGTIDDVQLLMRSAYHYWYHKGFWGVLCATLVNLANASILFVTVFLLTLCFRWDQASTCVDAACSVPSLFSTFHGPYILAPTLQGYSIGIVLLVSTGVSTAYEAVHAMATFSVQSQLDEMVRQMDINVGFHTPFHRFSHGWGRIRPWRDGFQLTETLLHNKPVLTTMSWNDFLAKLCAHVTRERKLRFCMSGASWDVLQAVQTLSRDDNLMVALQELGVLEEGSLRYLDVDTLRMLLPALFDPFHAFLADYENHSGATQAAKRLHMRAVRYAQCYLALYPFLVVFFLLKVLAKNAALLKQNLSSLKQYQWNARARCTFRLYNEVDHVFYCRLQTAQAEAVNMVSRLSVHTTLSRLVRRASSTCVLTVASLSLLNPSLLVMGTFVGVSFVWWLSISLLLFAGFPKADPRAREYNYQSDLVALTDSLHYDAPEWRLSGDSFVQHITYLFLDSVLVTLVKEVLSVLCVPFLLLTAARDGSLQLLCDAVQFCCVSVDGVGSVPRGAVFDDTVSESDEAEEDDEYAGSGVLWRTPGQHDTFQVERDASGRLPPGVHYQWRSRRAQSREKVKLSAASFIAVYAQSSLQAFGAAADEAIPSLTQGALARWRRTCHDAALHVADAGARTGLTRDDEGERSFFSDSEAISHAAPSTRGQFDSPGSPVLPPAESSRSGRYLDTARSGASGFQARSSMTAHEREHQFVSAVRRHNQASAAATHSATQSARATGTYGTTQSVRLDAQTYSSTSS